MNKAIQTVSLESRRFEGLDDAREYLNNFDIKDQIVSCSDVAFADGKLTLGSDSLKFTPDSWRQFGSAIVPGGSKFINTSCPPDLAEDIINRMLREKSDINRLVRVETDKRHGSSYVKAFLSDGYKPYDNKRFIDHVEENNDGSSGSFLRPAISGGSFSVNYVGKDSVINLPEAKDREIRLGVNYRNSEVGKCSISSMPFTFDSFCENGCIFGKKFIDAMSKRFIHRGANLESRVNNGLTITADAGSQNILKSAYVNMMNTLMTQLYFKHIAQMCIYPMQIMKRKDFEQAIPYVQGENRFDFYNRINRYAHTGNHSENKRLDFERLSGVVVEENMLS